MILPNESATFSSCRFNFFRVFLIPNSRYKILFAVKINLSINSLFLTAYAFIGEELKKELQRRDVALWNNWFTNLSDVGNIGSASIFVALEEYMRTRAKKGEKILLLVPESARFSYGAALLTVV